MFACSGPGGRADMVNSIQIGNWSALAFGVFVTISIVLYAISRRGAPLPIIFLGLFALHPTWTIDVDKGDLLPRFRGLSNTR